MKTYLIPCTGYSFCTYDITILKNENDIEELGFQNDNIISEIVKNNEDEDFKLNEEIEYI